MGFGGYTGNVSVAAVAAGATTASTPPTPSNPPDPTTLTLDPTVAQHLKRTSKRDAITRTKALVELKRLVPTLDLDACTLLLLPWSHAFRRLSLDNVRDVRHETLSVHAALIHRLAPEPKRIAPHLKALIGPWMIARQDPHRETRDKAQAAFANLFPPNKRVDVLVRFAEQTVRHATDLLHAKPADLGDDLKETPEELQERLERTLTQVFPVLSETLEACLSSNHHRNAVIDQPQKNSQETVLLPRNCPPGMATILSSPASLGAGLDHASPGPRAACYAFLQRTARTVPDTLGSALGLAGGAGADLVVVTAVGETHPLATRGAWEMLLTLFTHVPVIWEHVTNPLATLVPTLLAQIRQLPTVPALACLTPAILPLLICMPPQVLTPGTARKVLWGLLVASRVEAEARGGRRAGAGDGMGGGAEGT